MVTITASIMMAGCLLATACKAPPEFATDRANEVIIFIDFSQSIRRDTKALFQTDLERFILPSLHAGDRLIIAPINDKTFTSFHPIIEETFPDEPKFDGWNDNILKHNKRVRKTEGEIAEVKERIDGQVEAMFRQSPKSQRTDIFSSLLMAEKLFNHEQRRRVLVLMSDMIVDYPPYRFDRIKWTDEEREKMLTELQAKGMIPDLSGVCVYISGVTANSVEVASSISKFWLNYFERAQADMHPSRYAHVLLHWPPSKSCSS